MKSGLKTYGGLERPATMLSRLGYNNMIPPSNNNIDDEKKSMLSAFGCFPT